jgi:very-short-patch-repair endonuclease
MSYILNRSSLKDLRKKLRKDQPSTERLLWSRLRNRQMLGFKFRRQYSIGQYIVDSCCPEAKLIIELDGESHFVNAEAKENDKIRQNYLEQLGFRVLRFTNTELSENFEGVLESIANYLKVTSPNLSFEKERD